VFQKKTILALSDFGVSGISQSIHEPLKYWHDQGHVIFHLALGYNGIYSSVDEILYPWRERLLPIHATSEANKFGQNQIRQALEISKADIIISSFDVWMVDWLCRPEENSMLDNETKKILSHANRNFHHILFYPIDGLQENKYLPLGMEEGILGADSPITYSKFSQNAMQSNFNITVPMIPIAHDPAIFHPLDKKECRRKMHLDEDIFLISMVGTNQYRKSFGDFLKAAVPFAKEHDNVRICLFTTNQTILGGADIKAFIYKSGISDRFIDPSNMVGRLSDEGMNIFYNALDVLCLVTVGEGCGLPPLRARACGVPALVSNNTSNIEFAGHPFELIKLRGKYYDNFGSNLERYLTDTDDLQEKLEILYNNLAFRHEIGQAGIEHMKQFEVNNIMPMWDEVINNIPGRKEEAAA
jgi:glycosyltransferase involved in cell wall biosynthesis